MAEQWNARTPEHRNVGTSEYMYLNPERRYAKTQSTKLLKTGTHSES